MDKDVTEMLASLQAGKTVLYPTDTVWGLGCDAKNSEAVKRIYQLKQREESKSLIILVDGISMLKEYIGKLPEKALDILEKSEKPTTIIYEDARNLAPNTIAADGTIAIRIVQNEFCKKVIAAFGSPIVSTSANISGEPTAKSFAEISSAIVNNVDYVVTLYRDEVAEKSSTILKLAGEDVLVIRE
ncbi:Threonylcarbamoyl-AMP synthase [Tenacibaculum litopenaei]|jgi:L-threonylcarbamoyladenylate synthase|uniref:L-threonylcarbamoyladenylate synthase n=1 Tax=Tenacibaculum litopenaei TaxID=396016 RepID=UPI00389460BE